MTAQSSEERPRHLNVALEDDLRVLKERVRLMGQIVDERVAASVNAFLERDSAAAAAGIEVGDILLKVDGQAVGEQHGLHRMIADRKAGDTVAIEVLRDGRQQTLSATLKEGDAAPQMFERKIMAFCKDANGEEKDCPEPAFIEALDCGGDETCEVKVVCKDEGSCTCTINGEEKDCPAGVHGPR